MSPLRVRVSPKPSTLSPVVAQAAPPTPRIPAVAVDQAGAEVVSVEDERSNLRDFRNLGFKLPKPLNPPQTPKPMASNLGLDALSQSLDLFRLSGMEH